MSNLDCLHTMDWMSGEGHTGVVRCLQVDNHDQPRGVDVDHGNVEVGFESVFAHSRLELLKILNNMFHLQVLLFFDPFSFLRLTAAGFCLPLMTKP